MSTKKQQPEPLNREIIHYYAQGREAARLEVGIGPLESTRIKELIGRFIPGPPAVIVDVGGGPGIYACWLAKRGYEVHLVDAVALHVEQAEQASLRQPEASLASCRLGDARRLDYADAFADGVLLLGPLYHLAEHADRMAALEECRRIPRPGGVLLAVGISRFASLHVGLVRWWIDDPDFQAMVRSELADGRHNPPANWPGLFTTAYFHHPDELKQEISLAGFEHGATLAVQGAGWLVPDFEARWNEPTQREALLMAVRWTEGEPATLGLSPHLLAVARKTAALATATTFGDEATGSRG